MEIYTIGFTRKTAAEFFEALKKAEIKRIIDVRLNNRSQLAGFTKQGDIEYFLRELCNAEYLHMPILSPTKDMLKDYRQKNITWEKYMDRFNSLLEERKIAETLDKELFSVPTVLLCSESTPDHCHRRLLAEHLKGKWPNVTISHL